MVSPDVVPLSATVCVLGSEAAERPAVEDGRLFARGPKTRWLAAALLFTMSATVVALFWFPVKKSLSYQEVNYNEGWNAYKQAMAAKGIPIYATLRTRFTGTTSYPPLSFHLVGWLGRSGDFAVAGRRLALLSLLTTGILIGFIVRRATRNARAALFAFLLYELGIVLLSPVYIGMNDPQLPAEALCALGLYLYLRNPDSRRLLCLSALAFCLAGFYKQTIIAFPAAVGIDLLLRSWKRFAVWAGMLVGSAGALTALTFVIDGRYFLASLTSKRAYLYLEGLKHLHTYLATVQFPLLVAIIWCIYSRRQVSRRPLLALLVLTHLVGLIFIGGDGVYLNVFFSAWLAICIACGMALADMDSAFPGLAAALRKPGVSGAVMLTLFASLLVNVPRSTFYEFKRAGAIRADENDFRLAVQFVKARPGPALCETLLLCYEAGKPYEFDPYYVRDQLRIGRLHDSDLMEPLRTHYFQTVQLVLNPDDQARIAGESLAFRNGGYFTPPVMKELLEDYQLAMRTSKMLIFVPKG